LYAYCYVVLYAYFLHTLHTLHIAYAEYANNYTKNMQKLQTSPCSACSAYHNMQNMYNMQNMQNMGVAYLCSRFGHTQSVVNLRGLQTLMYFTLSSPSSLFYSTTLDEKNGFESLDSVTTIISNACFSNHFFTSIVSSYVAQAQGLNSWPLSLQYLFITGPVVTRRITNTQRPI
jgi:hypothetical protein